MAERNVVNVTITGLTGSGKSAVYGEIVIALKAIGVHVIHKHPKAWQSECFMSHGELETALQQYQPIVVIEERNIPRSGRTRAPWYRRLLGAILYPRPSRLAPHDGTGEASA